MDKKQTKNSLVKLHLGCGKRDFGIDWVHIDGGYFSHVRYHDVTILPFEDNSVDLIYASHLLEYFDREEVFKVLKEWKRALVNHGILRIAVPNFNAMVDLYLNKGIPINIFLGPLYGKMKMGDKSIYHKTAYDYPSLKWILSEIGFHDIKTYDWRLTEHSKHDDHSQAYIPHMEKDNGFLISLNVEASK